VCFFKLLLFLECDYKLEALCKFVLYTRDSILAHIVKHLIWKAFLLHKGEKLCIKKRSRFMTFLFPTWPFKNNSGNGNDLVATVQS